MLFYGAKSLRHKPKKKHSIKGKHYEVAFGMLYTIWQFELCISSTDGCIRVHLPASRDVCQLSLAKPSPGLRPGVQPTRNLIWTQP